MLRPVKYLLINTIFHFSKKTQYIPTNRLLTSTSTSQLQDPSIPVNSWKLQWTNSISFARVPRGDNNSRTSFLHSFFSEEFPYKITWQRDPAIESGKRRSSNQRTFANFPNVEASQPYLNLPSRRRRTKTLAASLSKRGKKFRDSSLNR